MIFHLSDKRVLMMFCSILIGTTLSISQDLTSVQDNLKTVETGKSTFRQELRIIEEGLVRYSVVEVDVKGKEKETQYVFSFADIDENTVRAITKKDIIIVQLLVSGKQKLVQVIANGGDGSAQWVPDHLTDFEVLEEASPPVANRRGTGFGTHGQLSWSSIVGSASSPKAPAARSWAKPSASQPSSDTSWPI